MDVFTKPYDVDVTFLASDGIFRMSITAQNGDITYTGGFTFRGESSEPVTIKEGGTVLLVANPNSPINGVTVSPGGNVAVVLIFFN
jgi:hypothetical protein